MHVVKFKVYGAEQVNVQVSQTHVVVFKVFPPKQVLAGHSQAQVVALRTLVGAEHVFVHYDGV